MAATHVHHMQKSLDQMNLQLHHVISDLGRRGRNLKGECDPIVRAKLHNERIKPTEEVIAKSLVGDHRHKHLFTLRPSVTAYRCFQKAF
jgi:transposase